ncbi:MAG: hypothetical protein DSY60_01840 [Persephonella sp.]|nr:MAG: hypothetical protein DSY60_01840 [Persephonella sp.]
MKGYIFLCDKNTCDECFAKNLFGTTLNKCKTFKNIKIGVDYIFLFDMSKKILHGIWKAVSNVGLIDKKAWGGKYLCQVKVKLMTESLLSIEEKELYKFGIKYSDKVIPEAKLNRLFDYLSEIYSNEMKKINTYIYLEKIRSNYPKEYKADDGHIVRSKGEKIIDDWLYKNNIKHKYEPIITEIPENLRPDWLVEGKNGKKCYIEYWGLEGIDKYDKYIKRKLEIYTKYKLPLIEIREENLEDLDFYLKNELRKKGIL